VRPRRSARRPVRRAVRGHAVVQDHRPGRGDGDRAARPLPPPRAVGLQHPHPVHRAAAHDRRALLRGRRHGDQEGDRRLHRAHRPARAGAQLSEP
ncbi:MAG: Protein QmcA (possibly involved in integral membrane quality control), partial [uncultured Gemmatimonadaceae bacterium]